MLPRRSSGAPSVALVLAVFALRCVVLSQTTQCAPGSFASSVSSCSICPVGAFCTGGSAAPLQCTCPAACSAPGTPADPLAALTWTSALVAGNGTASQIDGTGAGATVGVPNGGAVDAAGNYFVSDVHRVRRITPTGVVVTIAGDGTAAYVLGIGTNARLNGPQSIVVRGSDGVVFVAESGSHVIRALVPLGGNLWSATLFAGTPTTAGFADGPVLSATFTSPSGVALAPSGVLYVMARHAVRAIVGGIVSTLAGSTTGASGYADALGTAALFNGGWAIAASPVDGSIVVADWNNRRVRRVSPAGAVTTLSGGAISAPKQDGPPGSAVFGSPVGITVATSGVAVLNDYTNWGAIFLIDPLGNTFWIAGSAAAGAFADGQGTNIGVAQPCGVGILNGTITFSDNLNRRVRTLTCAPCAPGSSCTRGFPTPCVAGTFSDELATSCSPCTAAPGFACGAGSTSPAGAPCASGFFCVGGAAPARRCTCPAACNAAGTSADPENLVWTVATLAGSSTAGSTNGVGSAAAFMGPNGAVGGAGGVFYFSDQAANVIRAVSPSGNASTLAGNGVAALVNGLASASSFKTPSCLETDGAATVWVADAGNHVVRQILGGSVTTLAGSGVAGNLDATGVAATLSNPTGLAYSASKLYVAEGSRIRVIALPSAVVSTLAGSVGGFANGFGPAVLFASNTWDLDVDASGNLVIADWVRMHGAHVLRSPQHSLLIIPLPPPFPQLRATFASAC